MEYGISKYPYYHGVFGTDEYFEIYCCGDEKGRGIALFGKKEDAEEYIEWRQAREELLERGG